MLCFFHGFQSLYNFKANDIFVPTANIGLDEQDLVLRITYMYIDIIYSTRALH